MGSSFFRDYGRRDFLTMSVASALGLSCSGWLPRLARAAPLNDRKRSCILLWMNGGPSQLDTFDPKPGHENGGPFKEIQTAVPGIRISERLPRVARHMKDVAILRGMNSQEGDHGRATYLMRTGYRPLESVPHPSLGSLVAKALGRTEDELPNFVSISPPPLGRAAGAGFLGPEYAPLSVSGDSEDPQARANLTVENLMPAEGVDRRSLRNRLGLLSFLQSEFAQRHPHASAKAHAANYEQASRMVLSGARSAFNLEAEPAALREAYGRNRFGQGCLLARRLVERGVAFVEVTLANVPGAEAAWDTHANNFDGVGRLCEILDPAWSTLMEDLKSRGLLETTLIVWMGEFGRTPQINAQSGRDHFPAAWTTVLAGGVIKGGQVIGNTGASGMHVKQGKVTVPELFATICSSLGIDPRSENFTPEGRPIPIVESGGSPVKRLLADAPA